MRIRGVAEALRESLEPKARKAVIWAALSPLPSLAYSRVSRARGLKKALWVLATLCVLALGLIWLVRVGWILTLLALPPATFYSSAVRGRRAGLRSKTAEGIDAAVWNWPRPARALMKLHSLAYSGVEYAIDPPASAFVLGCALGFVSPLAAYYIARPERRSRLKSAIAFALVLVGSVWGVVWLVRVGWLIGLVAAVPASLLSSYRRRVVPTPPPIVEVRVPRVEVPAKPIPAAKIVYAVLLLQAV